MTSFPGEAKAELRAVQEAKVEEEMGSERGSMSKFLTVKE